MELQYVLRRIKHKCYLGRSWKINISYAVVTNQSSYFLQQTYCTLIFIKLNMLYRKLVKLRVLRVVGDLTPKEYFRAVFFAVGQHTKYTILWLHSIQNTLTEYRISHSVLPTVTTPKGWGWEINFSKPVPNKRIYGT